MTRSHTVCRPTRSTAQCMCRTDRREECTFTFKGLVAPCNQAQATILPQAADWSFLSPGGEGVLLAIGFHHLLSGAWCVVAFVRACVLGFSEWRGKEWKDGSRQVDTCVSYPATSARPCIWEGQRTDWRPLPTMPKCCAAETASLPWEGEEKVRGLETSRLPPRQRSMRVFACMCAQNSLCVHTCAYVRYMCAFVVYMCAWCKAHVYKHVKVQQRQSKTRG